MKVTAIIPAAGLGQRLPGIIEKPYIIHPQISSWEE